MNETALVEQLYGRCQMVYAVIYLSVALGNQQNEYGTHEFALAFQKELEQDVNTGIGR